MGVGGGWGWVGVVHLFPFTVVIDMHLNIRTATGIQNIQHL